MSSTRLGVIASVDPEGVPSLSIHLGVAIEVCANAAEADRRDATGAVHVETLSLVLIFQRAVQRVGLGDETKIDIGTESSSTSHTGTGLPRSHRAETRRDNTPSRRGHQLVREVRPDQPARGGIVGPVVGPHACIHLVIVGEGNVGKVLWVEGDLEKVSEAAVRSTTKAAR